eukprot:gene1679-2331_t
MTQQLVTTEHGFNKNLSKDPKNLLFETAVVPNSLNPKWVYERYFVNLDDMARRCNRDGAPPYLTLELWDRDEMPPLSSHHNVVPDLIDAFKGDDFVAACRVPFEYLVRPSATWFALFNPRFGKHDQPRNAGAILLEFWPENVDTLSREARLVFEPAPAIEIRRPSTFGYLLTGKTERVGQVLKNVYLEHSSDTITSRGDLLITSHELVFSSASSHGEEEPQEPSPLRALSRSDQFQKSRKKDCPPTLFVNARVLRIPLGSIESCRFKEPYLTVTTHEQRVIKFKVIGCEGKDSPELVAMQLAVGSLQDHIQWSLMEQQFCFDSDILIRWCKDQLPGAPARRLTAEELYQDYDLLGEFNRQGALEDSTPWRLTTVNKEYELCPTYPSVLVVPKIVADDDVCKAAAFRSRNRLPALTYWDKESRGAVFRCSQPLTGITSKHSEFDQALIDAITADQDDLLIIDCRPKMNATANQMAGKGFEDPDWYRSARIHFANIQNIHAMRASLKALANATWDKNCDWRKHVALTLDAGLKGYEHVKTGHSVLVHCSDGWDRTAQVSALIQIMREPFYRTIRGFAALIAKDWCAFGHKFLDRCGGPSEDEQSPIFVQFLDCVFQLQEQNEPAFEFNNRLLVFLAGHAYSRLFADFLFNSELERVTHLSEDVCTESIWSYVLEHEDQYLNFAYDDSVADLTICTTEDCMKLWEAQHRMPTFAPGAELSVPEERHPTSNIRLSTLRDKDSLVLLKSLEGLPVSEQEAEELAVEAACDDEAEKKFIGRARSGTPALYDWISGRSHWFASQSK